VPDLIWEHGKRNYALYLAGLKRIVCPIGDASGTTRVGIFDADPDEVDQIMRQDPAVKAGLFTYTKSTPPRPSPKARSPLSVGRLRCQQADPGSDPRGVAL
jgi:hypothetical protein